MNYHTLPKIDLHCHLDGSVRPSTIRELAISEGIQNLPEDLESELIAPETCGSLDEYLTRFEWPNKVMQTEEALRRITFEVFEDAAKENVKYLELRFGPLLHLKKGLSVEVVLKSVLKGMHDATSMYDIEGGIILSILKTMVKDQIKEVIDVGASLLDQGIVAIDLAGSERPGFAHQFVEHIAYAKEKGFHVTIHAGENGCPQNVTDSIELLHAERIGHGIDIAKDKVAFDLTKSKHVLLEVCPTSNIQTKGVMSYKSHPIKAFYDDQVLVSINTDNRTVSNTTMTKEVEKVMEAFNLTLEDYKTIYRYAVSMSFASNQVKEKLMDYIL